MNHPSRHDRLYGKRTSKSIRVKRMQVRIDNRKAKEVAVS